MSSYVILPPRAWNALLMLYSQPVIESPTSALLCRQLNRPPHCHPLQPLAVPRRLCPPTSKQQKLGRYAIPIASDNTASTHWIELYPVEVHVHWYIGNGCASECPSDTVLACSCCNSKVSTGRCNNVVCTVDSIVSRMLTKYGLDTSSNEQTTTQTSLTTDDFRVWVMITARSKYITPQPSQSQLLAEEEEEIIEDATGTTGTGIGSQPMNTANANATASLFYIPVLPYVSATSTTYGTRGPRSTGATTTDPSSTSTKRPDPPNAGTRPTFTAEGFHNTYWKLLSADECQSPVSALLDITGFESVSSCRIMIESKQYVDKSWPLDRIFGSADANPVNFWSPERSDNDVPDNVRYRKGDQVFARDALGE